MSTNEQNNVKAAEQIINPIGGAAQEAISPIAGIIEDQAQAAIIRDASAIQNPIKGATPAEQIGTAHRPRGGLPDAGQEGRADQEADIQRPTDPSDQ